MSSPLPPFAQPSAADFARAEAIVDSHPVASAYASCEWDCLNDDGKVWIAAIVREAAASIWPASLTPELRATLGLMCFQLGPLAHLYREAGEFVGADGALNARAEDEQAFMLHKLVGYVLSHGARWSEAADADIARVRAIAAAKARRRS